MSESPFDAFDAIDTEILVLLSEDPRMSYQKLSHRLAENGHQMSAEGVRNRVTDLMDASTPFFLLNPERVAWEWEIVRISVKATDGPGDKREAFEQIGDLPFWHVTMGIGTYDIYAVGIAPTLADVEALISAVRGYDCVAQTDHIVVTERKSELKDYYRQGIRENEEE